MAHRILFKELLAEAQAAGRKPDGDRTFYLVTEKAYVVGFEGEGRNFLITDHGTWSSSMAAQDIVDLVEGGREVPDLDDTFEKGTRFK